MKKILSLAAALGAAAHTAGMEAFSSEAMLNDQRFADLEGSLKAVGDSSKFSMGFESYERADQGAVHALGTAYAELEQFIANSGLENFDENTTPQQRAAAAMAMVAVNGESAYRKAQIAVSKPVVAGHPGVVVAKHALSGPFGTMPTAGIENYNEKSMRDFRVITVAYNLRAAKQDEFAEALYPTMTVNPTEGGVVQNLTQAVIMADKQHEASGQLYDTGEIGLVQAYRDPSILQTNHIKVVPIVEAGGANEDIFVDAAIHAPVAVVGTGGLALTTAPLKFGVSLDLIGNSNKKTLVSGGVLDITDTLDPAMRLDRVVLASQHATDAVTIGFKVPRQRAGFVPGLNTDSREVQLNMFRTKLVIDPTTRTVTNATGAAIDAVVANNLKITLTVDISGNFSTSKGNGVVNAASVQVESVQDLTTGEMLDPTAGVAASTLALFNGFVAEGYELDANFTNTNKRERGDLIQTRTMQFRHTIPMGSPITVPASLLDDEGPGAVVDALLFGTNLRASANAITRLQNYLAALSDVTSGGLATGLKPGEDAIEGALGHLIAPSYAYDALDLTTVVDGTKSHERWADVTQAILNKIKAMVFPLYRSSNIEAAFRVVSGDMSARPTMLILTDMEIANYMQMIGDDRTLGAYLKYKVVATNNKDFDGKIVVVPTMEKPEDGSPLNFGQFLYVPTIVSDLPISRNGQTSREITAIPFNIHIHNIPWAIELDVTGLQEVMGTSQFLSKL